VVLIFFFWKGSNPHIWSSITLRCKARFCDFFVFRNSPSPPPLMGFCLTSETLLITNPTRHCASGFFFTQCFEKCGTLSKDYPFTSSRSHSKEQTQEFCGLFVAHVLLVRFSVDRPLCFPGMASFKRIFTQKVHCGHPHILRQLAEKPG